MKPCSTLSCRKKAQLNRTICRSCRTKREREKDPERYAYVVLRKHAKERNIPFSITLDYFREFCVKTGYLAKKGVMKDSYHVDRKVEMLGYIPGNLQVLTNSENVKKFLDYKYCHIRQKMEFKMKTSITEGKLDSDPF